MLREVKLHDRDEMPDVFFSEVVLSSPADSGECTAVALLNESSDVAFCRVGDDGSWRLLRTGLTHEISCVSSTAATGS
jgi:hypothetical protein